MNDQAQGELTVSHPPDPPFPEAFQQSDLELAKWVAIVTMAIDHYGKIVDEGTLVETHIVGRLSFPLFAAIVGIRLAMRPSADGRYLRHLIPWALVSQPVYVLVGRDWYDGNILLTLALGVLAAAVLRQRPVLAPWSFAGSLLAIAAVSLFVEYGPFGVLMVPATAYFIARGGYKGLATAGPLGLLANATATMPPLRLADFSALLASPVLMLSVRMKARLPRLPTQAFYAFYPAHLLALHFYDLYG